VNDVTATFDDDDNTWIVSAISTTAFEWFDVLFESENSLADGSHVIKSLEVLKDRKLQVSIS